MMVLFAKLWAYLKHGPDKVQEFEQKHRRARPMKRPKQRVRRRRK